MMKQFHDDSEAERNTQYIYFLNGSKNPSDNRISGISLAQIIVLIRISVCTTACARTGTTGHDFIGASLGLTQRANQSLKYYFVRMPSKKNYKMTHIRHSVSTDIHAQL